MSENLVIIFVKNIKLGQVKTRLAKTIGNQGAFDVYTELVQVTEEVTKKLTEHKRIYFSEAIVDNRWVNDKKYVQNGIDLGERMKNAFNQGFKDGYKRIVLIGSDLPDITVTHINQGLVALKENDVVFGPAEDGGYYLIGQSKMNAMIFKNKPWSKSTLLAETLNELKNNSITYTTLNTLNDIDTYEDLIASKFYQSNIELHKKIKLLHD